MGYRLNRLDEPVFIAVSKPLVTEFGIYHRLESCVGSVAYSRTFFWIYVFSNGRLAVVTMSLYKVSFQLK